MVESRTVNPPQSTAGRLSVDSVTIRHLTGWGEYQAVLTLQQEVWGVDFADLVPASILKVSQRLGGVTAGAFAPDGRMLGFVFGITGTERGKLVHWSDMLGVRAEARDLGIGRRLKMFQRDALRPLGVSIVYWTYDPLVARNAYLNLEQFGTEVTEYVLDFYGARTSSTLHEGLGTDRFVVAWHIGDEADRPARRPLPPLDSPTIPILDSPAAADQQLLRPPTTAGPRADSAPHRSGPAHVARAGCAVAREYPSRVSTSVSRSAIALPASSATTPATVACMNWKFRRYEGRRMRRPYT